MNRWRGKIAVVTGASAGIGASLCKKLVEEGLQVVGLARRVEKIEELKKDLNDFAGKLHAVKCDVTNQQEVIKSFERIRDNIGPVQILINNAGVCKLGSFTDGEPETWKNVIDTNILGVLYCSHEVLKHLKELQLEGHIIHMNSVAGHYKFSGSPHFINAYSPAKNAVTCINDVMRQEMIYFKMKVKITSLSPGLIFNTEIRDKSSEEDLRKMPSLLLEDINDAVIYLLGTPPHVHVQELMIRPLSEFFC